VPRIADFGGSAGWHESRISACRLHAVPRLDVRNGLAKPMETLMHSHRHKRFEYRGRLFATLFILVQAPACREGPASGRPEDKPQPIPECQAYERAVSECAQRDISLASQTALAKTKAKRAELTRLCATNLHRIREACR
jgi:hypothetical protein